MTPDRFSDYSLEDIEFQVKIERLNQHEASTQVPENYFIQKETTEDVYVGKVESGDWTVIKKDDGESRDYLAGHKIYQTLSEHLQFNKPKTSYDEKNNALLVQHLGELEPLSSNLNPYNSLELKRHASIKALAGDYDLAGNIGAKDNKLYIIDFEEAGKPIGHIEDQYERHITHISNTTGVNLDMTEINSEISDLAHEIDLDMLDDQITCLSQCYPELEFELHNLKYNVKRAREKNVFSQLKRNNTPDRANEGSKKSFHQIMNGL